MRSIYLASPLGFAEATQGFMSALESMLSTCGFGVVNPWRQTDFAWFAEALSKRNRDERRLAFHEVNCKIAANNEIAIRQCELMVAVLDGVDVDSGTASEVGFGYGVGKRIYGYRGDSRLTGDNEGSAVNLQVQYWIEQSGGSISFLLEDLRKAIVAELGNG